MKILQRCAFITLICYTSVLHAAMPVGKQVISPKVQQFINHKDWSFVENKGQLSPAGGGFLARAKNGTGWDSNNEIKYYGHQGGVYLYCKPGMLSFVFTKTESNAPDQISEATGQQVSDVGVQNSEPLHRKQPFDRSPLSAPRASISTSRTDLVLLNSNPNAQIIASDQQEYYENYYTTGDADHGITNVHTYKTVTYKSIYPHIDMVLNCREQGMEYSFIVHPGGKVSDIQLQWNGTEATKALADACLSDRQGGFKFSNSLGTLKESAPKSFVGGKMVQSNIVRNGFEFGFKVGSYDARKDLVIDPSIVWSTYFGYVNENGTAIAADTLNNVLVTGFSGLRTGIATSGAYKTILSGGQDAYVAKFSSSGKLLWCTYLGGPGYDEGFGICSDRSLNVIVCGYTDSDSGIAASGAYQTVFGGDQKIGAETIGDAFLAKFSASGAMIWSTYFGGSGNECGYGVKTDSKGNIYMAGSTNSASGIATKGSFQASYGGGNGGDYYMNEDWGDAFLAKFSTSGSLQWSTYFGGPYNDEGTGLTIDPSDNVFLTGTSQGGNLATTGSFQSVDYNDFNAFIAKFTSGGSRIWSTFFGAEDFGNGIAADPYGNVFITGFTQSLTSGIASPGAWQTSHTGTYAAYIAKFSSTGSRDWSTYYTEIGDDRANNIATDLAGNAYITGYSDYWADLATSDAFQSRLNGYDDAFIAKFSSAGNRVWSSYYGGTNDEMGLGVCTDKNNDIYISGYTNSGAELATSGAFDTYFNSGITLQMAYIAKISNLYPNDAGIDSIHSPKNAICAGSQPVIVSLKNYGFDTLKSVFINWAVDGIIQTPYSWKGTLLPDSSSPITIKNYSFNPGQKVKLKFWTSSPNSLPDSYHGNDTSSETLVVYPLPSPDPGANQTICAGETARIGYITKSGDKYSWVSVPPGWDIQNMSNPFAVVNPVKTTIFYLTETNDSTGCSRTDSTIIFVNPIPSRRAIAGKSICIGDTINMGQPGLTGYSYAWTSFPSGYSSGNANPSVHPQKSTLYILKETIDSTGCQRIDSVQIIVNSLPVPIIDSSHFTICTGTHIRIGGNEIKDLTYKWTSSPQGFSSSQSGPIVNPAGNTIYFLKVTDTLTGCINSDTAKVVITVPKAPVSTPGFNQTICAGNSAIIGSDPAGGLSYYWLSDPSGFTSSISKNTVAPDTTTTYFLIVKNNIGCTDEAAVSVEVNPLPVPNPGSPQSICSGTAIKLGGAPVIGQTYSWTSNPVGFKSLLSDPIDTPLTNKEYFLKQTIQATGCSITDSIRVDVVPRPNVSFNVKNINGFQYQFTAEKPDYPAWQYHWYFYDSANGTSDTLSGFNVIHSYTQNGKYRVSLTVSLPGFCTETASKQIDINENFSLNIYPNPFNIQTDINYTLVNPAHIRISVVDEIGKQIGVILDKNLDRGEYNTNFNSYYYHTRPAMYFILFQIDDKVIVRKVLQLSDLD